MLPFLFGAAQLIGKEEEATLKKEAYGREESEVPTSEVYREKAET